MIKIVLTALNARYTHSAIGLRYLYANLKELKELTVINEFEINGKISDMAEKILKSNPEIIGISVYIWNASEVQKLIALLKKVSPTTIIVLGGPEASHLPHRVNFDLADYIVQGEGEETFYHLCSAILSNKLPSERIIKATIPDVSKLEFPYKYYTEHDIQNRVIYVEASRGCPFTCEFCLSSIDKAVRKFNVDQFLSEMEILWERGTRKFKFVDRTFNLDIKTTTKIMDFFLEKTPPYLLHFEMIPEYFPESLKEKIKMFPPASLQLEVGIQTLNAETGENISRKLNFKKIKENLHFLETETNAHLHVDLIIGLPGETVESFGANLNLLASLTSSEIQLGVLKKLSGTDISRHDVKFGMIYSDEPPYDILQNNLISFNEMQKMKRFARFWDITYNSGNFNKTIKFLWNKNEIFRSFYNFSEWLYSETESTWQISLNRMSELLFNYLTEVLKLDKKEIADTIVEDLLKIYGRRIPAFLKEYASFVPDIKKRELQNINKRQLKHL
ncbi:MAG: DUF4080 domain-containing protein [Melioribacteraceae bacterium]|nr:DUF4080 domain-containing protein [Melioribacteraceae bacterium]